VDEDGASGDDVVEMPESDRWLGPRRSLVSFFLLRLSTIAAHQLVSSNKKELCIVSI
jgi:hypothetical protein